MDAEMNDIASAIPIAWARDGQNVPTADMPMGGRKFVNVGAPVSVSNFMRVREFIENVPIFMQDAESSADRISVSSQYFTSVSANQAPVDGTKIIVRVKSNKSSAVLYLDGHSANIQYVDGGRIASALTSGGLYEFTYSSVDTAWKAGNPDLIESRIKYVRTAAEISAGVTPTNYQYEPYSDLRTGIDITGAADSTAAVQALIDSATEQYHHTVTLPHGIIRVDGTITVPEGVMIVGRGSGGTNGAYGTVIDHRSTSDCFVFDGSGTAFAGTGGGLKNVLIIKHTGFSGGNAILIEAQGDDNRPGEMVLENILSYGDGTGLWARGLYVDGRLADTGGSKGVRSVVGIKCRFADCTQNLQYVYLSQAVHCTFMHLQVDQGSGTGTVGMTIDEESENINLVGAIINGEIEINGDATHVNIVGRVSTLDVNGTGCVGTFNGSASTITNAGPDFKIVSGAASAWMVRLTADSLNVTGNGTVATIVFDTEDHDRGSNHSAGVVTVTQAGLYEVRARVTWLNLTASVTRAEVRIVRKNSGGSALNTTQTIINPSTGIYIAGGFLTQSIVEQFFVNEGDTFEVQVMASGEAGDTIDVEGSDHLTTFSGKLLA